LLSNILNPTIAIYLSKFIAIMKTFGSKWSTQMKAAKVNKPEKRRYMVEDEIQNFYEAIRSDPVLIQRFLTVHIGKVHILADKILDLLVTSWKEGLSEMLMPFSEWELMDNIPEQEVDALFIHFIDQYKGPLDNLAIDFWVCLKEEEKVVSATSHTEVSKNPCLKNWFSSISQTLFAEMMKKMIKVLVGKEVTTKLSDKFSEDVKKLRILKITDREFDEFTKLYFKMCSPYPEYLAEVWPNVVEMKKEIMRPSPIRRGISIY